MEYTNPFDSSGFPDEPPRGTVLAYQVDFDGRGIRYDYVSFRASNGKWYTTGTTTVDRSWGELWEWLLEHGVDTVKYATGWAAMETPESAPVDEVLTLGGRRIRIGPGDVP